MVGRPLLDDAEALAAGSLRCCDSTTTCQMHVLTCLQTGASQVSGVSQSLSLGLDLEHEGACLLTYAG